MNNRTEYSNITVAEFYSPEVKPGHRKLLLNEHGVPKYFVEIDPYTKTYRRDNVQLLNDPTGVLREAYILYNRNDLENLDLLTIEKILVNRVGLVDPMRIMSYSRL